VGRLFIAFLCLDDCFFIFGISKPNFENSTPKKMIQQTFQRFLNSSNRNLLLGVSKIASSVKIQRHFSIATTDAKIMQVCHFVLSVT
jgi:hypothetical protein